MTDSDELPLDPYVTNLIRRKSRLLVGGTGFTVSDRDDIEQELRCGLLQRSRSYDPTRMAWHAFVRMVVARLVANLLRDRMAVKRDPRRVRSLDAFWGRNQGQPPGKACSRCGEPDLLALDLVAVLDALPEPERDLARRLLQSQSIADIAREIGKPRTTVADAVRRLREHFTRAGLRDYLQERPSSRVRTG
jgi:DNA-directed RNA polymerase specialized sigma24 family protein